MILGALRKELGCVKRLRGREKRIREESKQWSEVLWARPMMFFLCYLGISRKASFPRTVGNNQLQVLI